MKAAAPENFVRTRIAILYVAIPWADRSAYLGEKAGKADNHHQKPGKVTKTGCKN